jgi:hypothetical protein
MLRLRAGEAKAAMRALAEQLERVNADAAASLREGLTDTLTVTRLGVTGSLHSDGHVDQPGGVGARDRLRHRCPVSSPSTLKTAEIRPIG